MDPLLISAAGGMRSRLESLDLLANNLANAGTSGYKADGEFYTLYAATESNGSVLPLIERNWIDFSQGVLTETGSATDVALSGRGFFVANGPAGPVYTRNGGFRVSKTGVLETQEGYALRAIGGRLIQTQSTAPITIQTTGEVSQDGQILGRLELVDFAGPEAIQKLGGNYFRLVSTDFTPVAATAVEVHQGKLESSNVGSAEVAVRLVSLLRQFEMLQKASSLGAEMNRKSIEEVARVRE
jgi:flagellar basal-body rod protein FlgF